LGAGFDLDLVGIGSGASAPAGLDGWFVGLEDSADAGTFVTFAMVVEADTSFPTGSFSFNADPFSATAGDFYFAEIEVGSVWNSAEELLSADVIVSSDYTDEADYISFNGAEGETVTIGSYGVVTDGTLSVADNGDATYTVSWSLTTDEGNVSGSYTGTNDL
jgi:hypothetical protein